MHALATLVCRLVTALVWAWLGCTGLAQAATYTADASAINASVYPWIDISATGTTISLSDDAVSSPINIGFTFTFGATGYTSVKVMSNGMLQFATTSVDPTNAALPLDGTSSKPNIDAVMIPLWDDLMPDAGDVRYLSQGTAPNRIFTVLWNAVPYTNKRALNATFQVQLHESGLFVFRYGAVDGSGGVHSTTGGLRNPSGATVGVELSNTDYVQYSRNTASVASGTTLVWTRVPGTPTTEYLFNEAAWAGTSGEVKDTAAGALHGTAAGLAATKPSPGTVSPAVAGSTGTCGYGVFNRTNKDYVALPAGVGNLGTSGSFTVTAWIRTTANTLANQRILVDDENNTSGFGLSLGDPGAGMLRLRSRGTASSTTLDSAAVINNNTWYFIAFGVNTATQVKTLYVYDAAGTQLAALSAAYTEASFGSDSGIVSIGGETNGASGSENTSSYGFAGNIDEVRVYSAPLTPWQLGQVRALTATCPSANLVASYEFEEAAWAGTTGEFKDTAGAGGGPYNGKAQGSALPAPATASPARSGGTGTCGYATLPGPTGNGGGFTVTGLPVSKATGAQTTLAFWMYWDGTDSVMPVGWQIHDLWIASGSFGFNTGAGDIYGMASTGLSGGWHHVVAVFTNGSVTNNKLYIDGVSKTLTQRQGTPSLGNAVVGSTLRVSGWVVNSSYRFKGRIDQLRVYQGAATTAQVATLYAETHACSSTVDHVELRVGSASGLTCAPTTITVAACQDAACTTPYTGGLSGTLSASGAGMSVNWSPGASFSIPPGSSTTTVNLQLTTAGSVLVGASGLSPSPSGATNCNFGSPQCTFTAAAAGLVFDVADHVAETSTTFSVSAVGSAGGNCNTAFASTTRAFTFACSYANPATGSRPARVAGTALNSGNSTAAACDAGGRSVNLSFNASGVASTTLLYADVGQVQLTATYTGSVATGDSGLVMTGIDRFIAAPASFGFSAITAGPIRAGNAFSATVSARNSAGATTPNFGRESVPESAVLAFNRYQPTGAGAVNGSFSGNLGSFTSGSATATDLAWSEVGTIDLTATLASGSYLGSGFTATGNTGSTGAVGRFIPHHFDVALTAACGAFSYAGQPFTATVTARNADNGTTLNYDGSGATSPHFAKAVTLAEASALGLGALGASSIAAGAFSAGVASGAPLYSFTSKTTAPQSLVLRATDTDAASSAGHAEAAMALRSGRLRLSNAFGKAGAALQLPVVTEHWSGNAWVLNSADSCTTLPASSVALSNPRSSAGGSTTASTSASAITLNSGSGLLTLAAPSPAGSGLSLDIAINLGSTAADQSCHASHPATTGAARAWLRAQNGACAASADRDPAARASFGIFSPETRKTVHVREIF